MSDTERGSGWIERTTTAMSGEAAGSSLLSETQDTLGSRETASQDQRKRTEPEALGLETEVGGGVVTNKTRNEKSEAGNSIYTIVSSGK